MVRIKLPISQYNRKATYKMIKFFLLCFDTSNVILTKAISIGVLESLKKPNPALNNVYL